MPGPVHQVEAWVLIKRAPAESFQTLSLFSVPFGSSLALQRISKKTSSISSLDLFDQAALVLEEPTQGQAFFIKEARILTRMTEIGHTYEALVFASKFAALVARNSVAEESRASVYALLGQSFAAFGQARRADIVYFKALYRFCRDEGYPLKQAWLPTLPASDQALVTSLLNLPVAEQTAEPRVVTRLLRRLEDFLKGETEILLE
jgi:hypothetical protein